MRNCHLVIYHHNLTFLTAQCFECTTRNLINLYEIQIIIITDMADLKKDLDEYLLLQSDQKKNFKIQMPTIPAPKITGWFKKNQPEETESWYQETKRECCPSLVIIHCLNHWFYFIKSYLFQSRFQRFTLFGICICMGILCFSISLMYIPVLLFKARKFALLFTLGSIFFVLR